MRITIVDGIDCPDCAGRLRLCFCHHDTDRFLGFDEQCRTMACASNAEHIYRLRADGEDEGTHAGGKLFQGRDYGCRRGSECDDHDPEREG